MGGKQRRRSRVRDILVLSPVVPLVAGAVATAVAINLYQSERLDEVADIDTVWFVAGSGAVATLVTMIVVWLQRRSTAVTLNRLRTLETQANQDQLTGLPTRDSVRASLDEALQSSRARTRHVAVLFLDLDGFKGINDSMGHETGDQVLKSFAVRLKQAVRASDIVGRFGGDEFIVICTGLAEATVAGDIAQNVLTAFGSPLATADASLQVVPSIGYAVNDQKRPVSGDELIARADQAMYRAKHRGGGIAEFDGAEQAAEVGRAELERAIVPGLAAGQFGVHYQVVYSVKQARPVAVEGLVRWAHPEHGVLAPDAFLKIAEEAGMASRLGDVVLREVIAQTSIWNHMLGGRRLVSSLNLSERQLVDPTFPDRVNDLTQWCGVDPRQLHMEISEDVLLRRATDANRVVDRLSELGCRIVVDDFGLNQGAFARIRSLSCVDVIKIDGSVVRSVVEDDISRAVVEATVSMADALQVQVVAEGVETVEQRDVIADLGIDLMQGYLFQTPTPAETLGAEGPYASLGTLSG